MGSLAAGVRCRLGRAGGGQERGGGGGAWGAGYQTPAALRRTGRTRLTTWLRNGKVRGAEALAQAATEAVERQRTTVPGAVGSATLPAGVLLAEPAAAHAPVQPVAASVYTLSAGRVGAIVAALLALTAAVTGGLALARSTRRIVTGPGRRAVVAALVAALIAMALGALVTATDSGGIGTGNGLGGAVVALIVRLISTALHVLALTRSHRSG